jgi:hypothetical protein
MEPNNLKTVQPDGKIKLLLIVLAVLLALVGAYYFFAKHSASQIPAESQVNTFPTSIVTTIDVPNTPVANRLPQGFPSNIPVENQNITKSFSVAYTGNKSILYVVIYTSSQSVQAKSVEYAQLINSSSFANQQIATSTSMSILQATEGNSQLSVTVNSQTKGSSVQISFLNKP